MKRVEVEAWRQRFPGEEGLTLQVRLRLVQLGLAVNDPCLLKGLADPLTGIPVTMDLAAPVVREDGHDLPDHPCQVRRLAPHSSPAPHHILDHPHVRAFALGVNHGEGEAIGSPTGGVHRRDVTHAVPGR